MIFVWTGAFFDDFKYGNFTVGRVWLVEILGSCQSRSRADVVVEFGFGGDCADGAMAEGKRFFLRFSEIDK